MWACEPQARRLFHWRIPNPKGDASEINPLADAGAMPPKSNKPPVRSSFEILPAFGIHRSAFNRIRAFTLVELLAVIAVIAVLIALLLPALSKALASSRRVRCLSNQHQIGIAISNYAVANNGCIPYGPPVAPPFTTTNFYPLPGTVTSLISLQSGAPVGLGLMLNAQLANSTRVLFCPDADQDSLADQQLANVGIRQAQCDYYYRHDSVTNLVPDPSLSHLKLAGLGTNSQGHAIRALVMDVDFLCAPGMAIFGVNTRTNHRMQTVNVLFSDGHAQPLDNRNAAYTVDARANVENSFTEILAAFENADGTTR
jgi:prepilin-type N-terminal cleavage/methylation domain-containing protein/prepilin-type processing-associated H-X9-DG protein